jgi:rhodanese-related sulfurtransferase
MNNLTAALKNTHTAIVDVRTAMEFMGGHVAGSINIPLNEIPSRIDELKAMAPLVLCCASGGRSMQASMFLKQHGIDCIDGGSWLNVNNIKNN